MPGSSDQRHWAHDSSPLWGCQQQVERRECPYLFDGCHCRHEPMAGVLCSNGLPRKLEEVARCRAPKERQRSLECDLHIYFEGDHPADGSEICLDSGSHEEGGGSVAAMAFWEDPLQLQAVVRERMEGFDRGEGLPTIENSVLEEWTLLFDSKSKLQEASTAGAGHVWAKPRCFGTHAHAQTSCNTSQFDPQAWEWKTPLWGKVTSPSEIIVGTVSTWLTQSWTLHTDTVDRWSIADKRHPDNYGSITKIYSRAGTILDQLTIEYDPYREKVELPPGSTGGHDQGGKNLPWFTCGIEVSYSSQSGRGDRMVQLALLNVTNHSASWEGTDIKHPTDRRFSTGPSLCELYTLHSFKSRSDVRHTGDAIEIKFKWEPVEWLGFTMDLPFFSPFILREERQQF